MRRLLVICGPTATGKTELGIRLAKRFVGEIISADSRQVYRGMDIATGKDINNFKFQISNFKLISSDEFQMGYYQKDGTKIWMLDVVWPNQEFSVAGYLDWAWKIIENIEQRKKLPIIVGGTGFYIKAVVDGIPTKDIPRNPSLRKSLEGKSASELFTELEVLDSLRAAAMNVSDRKNPRRLARAIEIAYWRQENRSWVPPKHEVPDTLFIGLTAPNKLLYQKIDKRIDKWLAEGAEEEVRKLLKKYQWDSSALGETLGYKEWRPYFEDKITLDEAIRRWKFNEHHYARRQMTWFKRDPRILWIDITRQNWKRKVELLIKQWYNLNQSEYSDTF